MTRFKRSLLVATFMVVLPLSSAGTADEVAPDNVPVSVPAGAAAPDSNDVKPGSEPQPTDATPAKSDSEAGGEPDGDVQPVDEQAEPEPEDPALVQQARQFIAHLVSLQARVEVLYEEADGTEGEDREVLDRQIAETKLDFLETVAKLVGNLQAQQEEGLDGTEARGVLEFQLTRLGPAIVEHIEAGTEKLAALRKKRSSVDPVDRPTLELEIDRQVSWILALLQAYSDQVQQMAVLGLDNDSLARDLSRRLANRADRLLGRTQLVDEQLIELEKRSQKAPDDMSLTADIELVKQRKKTLTDALKHVVDLMDVSKLDSSQYRQFLIRTTGELTADVFRTSVMKSLLDEWTLELRDRTREYGPYIFAQVVFFLLILAFFKLLATITRRLTSRAMARSSTGISQLQGRMLLSLASRGVMAIGILVALSQLGIELGPLLAGLGIAGFIVGFALQDSLANFASGVMILAYRPFDVGDFIEAGGVRGNVSHMSLVSTTIITFDNQTLIVPNSKIGGDVIKNITNQDKRRVDMSFHVSYDDDMEHAERVFAAICADHPKVLSDPEPMIKVHQLGKSSIEFAVRPWVETGDYWEVYWDVTREVRKRFVAEGFAAPLPQREIHLRPPHANDTNA